MTRSIPPLAPTEATHASAGSPVQPQPDALLPLVRKAGAGDREALARLLSLIGPSVVATVRLFAGRDRQDVDDASQEALIAIADAVPKFRGDSSFLHYARRIAVRTALGVRRGRRQAQGRLEQLAAAPSDVVSPSSHPPNQDIEREEKLEVFCKLLDELPEGQAESLMYRVLLEYPLPIIARETGVPVNTVRSRIRLARDHLRDRILADPALAALLREPT